jgi:hypothetical protein
MSKIALSFQSLAPLSRTAVTCAAIGCSFLGCSDSDDDASEGGSATEMSFFVTSTTHDGDLGGLAGADDICNDLADAAGSDKTFAAYLSAENGGTAINARDRIGDGPWYNADGALIAQNLTALHAPTLVGNADLFITEKAEKVNGQWNAAAVNEHDVITGSDSNGMLLMVTDMTTTCADWTSNSMAPGPQVGHTDGMGPGMDTTMTRFTSWNGGHAAAGCSAADLQARGSTGRFYCFATN